MTEMMKAMQIEKYGHTDLKLRQLPIPLIEPHDVLIAVRAASVNPIDFKTRDGEVKMLVKHHMPLTLGHDFAGVIVKVGSQVTNFKKGRSVWSAAGFKNWDVCTICGG